MNRPIHITASKDNDGRLRYAVAPTITAKHREAERGYARLALYNLMGSTTDPLSPPLPLAPPRNECDCVSCPPPARVRLQGNGGLQPSSVVPRPVLRTPARQASSLCSQWVPPHYHKFFCAHDRFRGLPCPACRRSAGEAREWLEEMDITV
jgi:hypothetical protein